MDKIKWAICDDNKYLCFTYQMELESCDELSFSGAVHTAKDCMDFLKKNPTDVLLMDIQMETETAGIDIIPDIKAEFENIKIIILTVHKDEQYIFEAFANGANDYFIKTNDTKNLITTIKNVYQNNSSLQPEIAQIITNYTKKVADNRRSLLYTLKIMTMLSTSEFEILRLICRGFSYKEISEMRFVDLGTVKSHVSRILKKFDANNMKKLADSLNEMQVFSLFNDLK